MTARPRPRAASRWPAAAARHRYTMTGSSARTPRVSPIIAAGSNWSSNRRPVSQRINFTLHCGGNPTAAASVRVGGSAFFANGRIARDYQYTGPCPVSLKFDWGIVSGEPTSISYAFLRNDGARGPSATRPLPGGGHSESITTDWRLGANLPQFQNYNGWMELHTDPPHSLSNRISFTLHCQ